MKQLTGNQVRQMFLDYFKSKGHMIEPGASLNYGSMQGLLH